MARYLLFGGEGFIGHHLIENLLAACKEGFVTSSEDETQYYLMKILDNFALRDQMSKKVSKNAQVKYSVEKYMKKLIMAHSRSK
jgi:nucleoside-diphosphate-sugar epimerase